MKLVNLLPTDLQLNEELRDIPGYERLYACTNLGRIWSYPKIKNNSRGMWLVLFLHSNYMYCSLGRSHRVIAKTFLSNPGNKPYVNHKDGNKLNNNVDNLEWCSAKENMHHAHSTGLMKEGLRKQAKTKQSIPDKTVLSMRETRATSSLSYEEIARHFGYPTTTVYRAINKLLVYKEIK